VNLENRVIDFRTPEEIVTRKRKVPVRMGQRLYEALRAAKNRATTDHVIEYGGESVAAIKTGFRAACQRAGLARVTPHALRHTAVSWMIQAGVSTRDAADRLRRHGRRDGAPGLWPSKSALWS
jgi:integrase